MVPKNGLVTDVQISKWRDADTPVVAVVREFPVRLLDTEHEKCFNAPEKNTPEGKRALAFIKEYCKDRQLRLYIPTNNPINLTDINSFDRIVGELWVSQLDGSWRKVTDILYENGYGEYRTYK